MMTIRPLWGRGRKPGKTVEVDGVDSSSQSRPPALRGLMNYVQILSVADSIICIICCCNCGVKSNLNDIN